MPHLTGIGISPEKMVFKPAPETTDNKDSYDKVYFSMNGLFRYAFIAVFCTLTAIRSYYKIKTGLFREIPFNPEEGIHHIVIRCLLGIPLLMGTYQAIFQPEKVDWTCVPLPVWLRLAGIPLALCALVLLGFVHQKLGKNFSTNIRFKQSQDLVTSGPYRYIRHPMYMAYLVLFIAAFLISRNLLVSLSGTAVILLLMTSRLRVEEAQLKKHFGQGV